MKQPELHQFWRDTVNGDVLKILSFSFEVEMGGTLTIPGELPGTDYVRCACFPRGESFFGIQEMKVSRLDGERFIKVNWMKSIWFRLKFQRLDGSVIGMK
jgi:hypothetical protein